MQEEVWKPAPGFEKFYAVSNHGRVKALARFRRGVSKAGKEFQRDMPEAILKLSGHTAGYLCIGLTQDAGVKARSVLAHRLVAEAFLENPDNLPWVNHKDGDKKNNHVSNLEWCTPSYNIMHAHGAGFVTVLRGSERGTAKLNEDKVHVIKKMMLLGFTNQELAEIFKVSTAPISYIRNNHAWTHVPW